MKKIREIIFKRRQLIILAVFSLLISAGAIIHGIYMDLEFAEIKRLTGEGLLLTFFVVFPAIVFLEWIFDINNDKRFKELEKKFSDKEE